jgi:predicted house-cleaning noncanonical NTP pyrophosphatase (MazG superfamily)
MARPEDLVGYKEWKKVVRDKVASRFPQGVVARVTYLVLDHERWLLALYEKLKEEVAELDLAARHLMAQNPHTTTSFAIGGESTDYRKAMLNEVVDVLDVLEAITKEVGFTTEEIYGARRAKRESHGGFDDCAFLIWTHGYDVDPEGVVGEVWLNKTPYRVKDE